MNNLTRRQALVRAALGFGSLPLRSLVTGLPLAFLTSASTGALAQSINTKKYLILSHRRQGDPLNANAPGTYAQDSRDSSDFLNQIEHPSEAELGAVASGYSQPVEFNLGNKLVKAAAPWSRLDDDLRARMGFWHHGTFVNAHSEFSAARRFNGAIRGFNGSGSEELAAFIAQETRESLSTLTADPITVGGSDIEVGGLPQPILSPTNLKRLFSSSSNNIDMMVAARDKFIDRAYKDVKENGTPAQVKFLDNYARSRREAALMGDSLGELISGVNNNSPASQARVAVALLQLNITPVVTVGFDFGGDNHDDNDLASEVAQTESTMQTLNVLWRGLKAASIEDRAVFASYNVFGRNLLRNAAGGRNHNSQHHCMLTFGPNTRPGVIGGVEANVRNGKVQSFGAAKIDSVTGGTGANSDIRRGETLAAVGKTLARSVGISEQRIAERIHGGKIIEAAIIT